MLISFIMPAYKSEFLREALESIVSQTSHDWELVVVDDASPNNLRPIVEEYCIKYPNVRYYRNEKNIGGTDLVAQWNHSIAYAEGDWIVLAADDDVYAADFCYEVSRLIEKYPNIDLVRARVLQIDEKGKPLFDDGNPSEYTDKKDFLRDWLVAKIFTCVGNYAFRRKSLIENGGFIEYPCAFCSDVATPIALSRNGVAHTKEILFSFRHSSVHLSGDNTRMAEKIDAANKLYRWLSSLDYIQNDRSVDDVLCKEYIHDKCIYDYFNQAIRFSPLGQLFQLIGRCDLASPFEKGLLLLRWLKNAFHVEL